MNYLDNRYVRLAVLTIGLGLIFWFMLWFVLQMTGVRDFPVLLQAAAAFLGAGVLVAKIFASRVF